MVGEEPRELVIDFTAVQEQLGLKLEAMREAVRNLMVDHMMKPTGN